MKYYLIVGEASGDLHASHLMRSIKKMDTEAEFRFFGGDNMIAAGGTCVRHYKTIAYMGFIPVLLHLRTISKGMAECKRDILEWQPDVVIPVDYAGFNLSICKFLSDVRKKGIKNEGRQWNGKIFYYIAPKIWAWKEYRIKNFKRDVDEMFSILPFEVDFFTTKHKYPIHYVGNPTADEVRQFRTDYKETKTEFCLRHGFDAERPIIALLAGSRRQEIKDNLPAMIAAAKQVITPSYQPSFIVACAPSIDMAYYHKVMNGLDARHVSLLPSSSEGGSSTYELLSHADAALVTSGTATLETAIFDIPQVVCYKTPLPRFMRWAFNNIIKCRYISLVNLIADREVVQELFADRFSITNIATELRRILPGSEGRACMLHAYDEIDRRLGNHVAPDNAAREMIEELMKNEE